MARAQLQRAGRPCVRPPCRASGSFGGRQARAVYIFPSEISDALRVETISPSPATTPTLDWAEKVMTESFLCK
eukprot:262779-Alexandrium_andersonii.AAC.1